MPDDQAVFTPQIVRNRQSLALYAALDAIVPSWPPTTGGGATRATRATARTAGGAVAGARGATGTVETVGRGAQSKRRPSWHGKGGHESGSFRKAQHAMGHLDVTVERIGIGQESDALVDGGKVNGGGLDFEVVLPAGSKLGMSLTHNETHVKHGQIGCKVAKVQDGSAAALTGKIQVHDWILAVNGITVSHDTKDDVIRAVQGVAMSGAPVTLRFRRQEVRGRRREGERERERKRKRENGSISVVL